MGLWGKSMIRTNNGSLRKEDDRTSYIDEFFANQESVSSYELIDNKNWTVNVEGSIHLYDDDLNEGELFFRIGKLTGNLYCHCKYIRPSVVPAELEGVIVFVQDEASGVNKGSNSNDEIPFDMGMITAEPKEPKVRQSIQSALSHLIENDYDIDIDVLLTKIKDEKDNAERYELKMVTESGKRGYTCNFYISNNGTDTLIDLTSIEKTIYMLFIINENGYIVDDITPEFTKKARKIYSQLSDRKQDDENGVMGNLMTPETVRGYLTEIREAFRTQLSYHKLIEKFAIEGYKGRTFKVDKATDALREQIHTTFGV